MSISTDVRQSKADISRSCEDWFDEGESATLGMDRWEPSERAGGPVWLYPRDRWTDARYRYDDEVHGPLRARIRDALQMVVRQARDVDIADAP